MSHDDPHGSGSGFDRQPGDRISHTGLSLAVLECDEREAQAHLAALEALVSRAAGTIRMTEVTSTCLAVGIDAPGSDLTRIRAALLLGGAAILPCPAARDDWIMVILVLRVPNPKD